MPSVDVVISCCNYGHLLRQCVRSVLSQGVAPLRVIIIDNASADDSVEVAYRLAAEDERIEVGCHAENVGSHGSFNEGIDLATADYMMILRADDVLTPGALRTGIGLLERHPEAAVALGAPGMEPWRDGFIPVPPEHTGGRMIPSRDFVARCCRVIGVDITANAMLVRTSAQKAAGHYRRSLPLMDDLEMALRLACQGAVAELSAPLVVTGLHGGSISRSIWQDRLRDLMEREDVFASFFANEGAGLRGADRLQASVHRRLAAWGYWSGLSHLVRGRRAQATALFAFARRNSAGWPAPPPVWHLRPGRSAVRRAPSVIAEALRRGAT